MSQPSMPESRQGTMNWTLRNAELNWIFPHLSFLFLLSQGWKVVNTFRVESVCSLCFPRNIINCWHSGSVRATVISHSRFAIFRFPSLSFLSLLGRLQARGPLLYSLAFFFVDMSISSLVKILCLEVSTLCGISKHGMTSFSHRIWSLLVNFTVGSRSLVNGNFLLLNMEPLAQPSPRVTVSFISAFYPVTS